MLLFVFIGFFLGYSYIYQFYDDVNSLALLIAIYAGTIIGIFLNVILHELGHLVGGLQTGHRFLAMCIFSITIVKENGRLRLKRYRVPGVGGGCILTPPDMKDGTFSFKLCVSGGFIMNFLIGTICLMLFYYLADITYLWANVFLLIGIFGVYMGIMNLIPFNIFVPSDGYLLFNMGKPENMAMRHGFWSGSNAQRMDAEGVRPRDIPAELYDWVDMNNIDNIFLLGTLGNRYRCLLDKQEFDQARELVQFLLDNTKNISEMQKTSLDCDLLFHELINECRPEELDRLYTKKLKKIIKLAHTDVGVQRILYAYARLALNDTVKAKEHLDLFNKACTRSIFSGTVLCERDMIALIDKIADERGIV